MGRRLVILGIILIALGGCTSGGGSTPVVPSPTATPQAQAILTTAVQHLEAARSYRFTIEMVHHWIHEGRAQDWVFQGEGAYQSPNRFQSHIEGPADSYRAVVITGSQVAAWDARGLVRDAKTTFGGPVPGASPYTIIAYLKNSEQPTYRGVVAVAGGQAHNIGFSPRMAAVAALDEAHRAALERIYFRSGELLIDTRDGLPRQERVVLDYLPPVGELQTVTATLTLYDFVR